MFIRMHIGITDFIALTCSSPYSLIVFVCSLKAFPKGE